MAPSGTSPGRGAAGRPLLEVEHQAREENCKESKP